MPLRCRCLSPRECRAAQSWRGRPRETQRPSSGAADDSVLAVAREDRCPRRDQGETKARPAYHGAARPPHPRARSATSESGPPTGSSTTSSSPTVTGRTPTVAGRTPTVAGCLRLQARHLQLQAAYGSRLVAYGCIWLQPVVRTVDSRIGQRRLERRSPAALTARTARAARVADCHVCTRLQPHAPQAAATCTPGCSHTHPRLPPHAPRLPPHAPRLPPHEHVSSPGGRRRAVRQRRLPPPRGPPRRGRWRWHSAPRRRCRRARAVSRRSAAGPDRPTHAWHTRGCVLGTRGCVGHAGLRPGTRGAAAWVVWRQSRRLAAGGRRRACQLVP